MKVFAVLMAALLMSACANPEIVSREQLGDMGKSCVQLQYEIADCDKAMQELAKEKGMTGKNVAAVLFFWPALIATHTNVNEATKALNERKSYLMSLYINKHCDAKLENK